MNVFVLCTGRCGSLGLARACSHIRNFSSGHETRTSMLGEARFQYPSNHIEIDNRLSWLLGRLNERYGDSAYYVHLLRDPEAVARSYAARHSGLMKAYRGSGILAGISYSLTPEEVAADLVQTVNTNITEFLRDKPNVMVARIEDMPRQFEEFADWIGAEVDLQAASAEFAKPHNSTSFSLSATLARSLAGAKNRVRVLHEKLSGRN